MPHRIKEERVEDRLAAVSDVVIARDDQRRLFDRFGRWTGGQRGQGRGDAMAQRKLLELLARLTQCCAGQWGDGGRIERWRRSGGRCGVENRGEHQELAFGDALIAVDIVLGKDFGDNRC